MKDSAPRTRLLRSLFDNRIRANPGLKLFPFANLSDDERASFGSLINDPAQFCFVRDQYGAIKVVDCGVELLLNQLREPQAVKGALAEDEVGLVRLVLDGLIEVEASGAEFVSGSRAFETVCGDFSLPSSTTKTGLLSQRALQYAQALGGIDDALRLSVRLYFYGRIAASPDWLTRYATRESVERFLQIEPGGGLARRMRRAWQLVELTPPNDGWFLWRSQQPSNNKLSSRYKLYVSPLPEAVPPALAAAADTAEETGAVALKVGNDAASLLRPDKIVLYFSDLDSVIAAAQRLTRKLAGCPGQGVPFTAELVDSDGLVSYGIDPPRPEFALAWQERESWRLWLTNRLAVALLSARRNGGQLEPWQYAIARLEIDGVDPSTWAPSGDLWEEVV